MKRLEKDYYALPEAAERSGCAIDDFLWLAEHRKIKLSVNAHHWPIVWGDERAFPGCSEIEIDNPIKPPFDYYNSGYLDLCWYDIRSLRMHKKLSLSEVYAEKDGREYVGSIQRGTTDCHARQHEFELELNNVFISNEELLLIENHAVGDWKHEKNEGEFDREGKTALKPIDGRSARKDVTAARNAKWQRKCEEILNKKPDMKIGSIAAIISRLPMADSKKVRTISRIIKLPKKLAKN